MIARGALVVVEVDVCLLGEAVVATGGGGDGDKGLVV